MCRKVDKYQQYPTFIVIQRRACLLHDFVISMQVRLALQTLFLNSCAAFYDIFNGYIIILQNPKRKCVKNVKIYANIHKCMSCVRPYYICAKFNI